LRASSGLPGTRRVFLATRRLQTGGGRPARTT
jgi:hypothetical protein